MLWKDSGVNYLTQSCLLTVEMCIYKKDGDGMWYYKYILSKMQTALNLSVLVDIIFFFFVYENPTIITGVII